MHVFLEAKGNNHNYGKRNRLDSYIQSEQNMVSAVKWVKLSISVLNHEASIKLRKIHRTLDRPSDLK